MSTAADVRDALVVATAEYVDPKLQRLRAPAADAERLAAVLRNPEIGGFGAVDIALNAGEGDLRRRVARFFSNRSPNDLLFLHLSCHGVKDAHGDLYLAAADTELDLLSATGVPAAWLNEQLSRTRSRRTVVLLDCCFSGSFPFGARARAGGELSMPDQFEGHGRGLAVITASSAMEYAYEGDSLSGEGQPSFFTEAVVEALESGKADRDQDQLISIQELYDYVYERVQERSTAQTPNMKSELQGPLYIARSVYQAPVEPGTLDEPLVALTRSHLAGARLGAVEELGTLLGSGDPGLVLAARNTLEVLLTDDSRRVSERAREMLEAFAPPSGESAEPPPPAAVYPPAPRPTPKPSAGDGSEAVELLTTIPHRKAVKDVAFSPDGECLATASDDKTVGLWSTADGTAIGSLEHSGFRRTVDRCVFSPDGRFLATTSSGGRNEVWDLSTRQPVRPEPPQFDSSALAFSPDGRHLAVTKNSAAILLEISTWAQVGAIEQGGGVIGDLAISPDGGLLAVATFGQPVRVWDIVQRRCRHTFDVGGTTRRLSFSPDGRYLAAASAGSYNGALWDLAEGTEARGAQGLYLCVAFNSDGSYIASATPGGVRLSTVPDLREVVTLEQLGKVWEIAFSPDGRRLALAQKKTAQIWSVPAAG